MEAYATALTYAIPGFVGLIIFEAIAARIMGKHINRDMDFISSLSSGMTNTLKSMLGLTITILSYEWIESRFGIFDIKSSVWLYIIAFIGIDFASYWGHRFNHVINIFWNRHIVHHSSEEFNLACALRQSISDFVKVYFFLLIPVAIIGVPFEIIAITSPIHLFAQFWYHTRLIGKMGFLEYIIVTPSHHRVHHAINPEYIDKNYAAIFIVWDKWFGTFQEELPNVPPVYGTKRPANTWNPFIINFMHVWMLIQDAWRTNNWWDKLTLWFRPTGYRPADVKEKYPIYSIEDVFKQQKYDTPASIWLKGWSWAQLVINNLLLYFMLTQVANLEFVDIVWYSAFLAVSIFSYTTLMDRHPLAVPVEFVKLAMGIFLFWKTSGWFGIDGIILGGSMIVMGYMILSFLATVYFTWFEEKREKMAELLNS